MGKAERRKGHDWERKVAQMYREVILLPVARGQQGHRADAPDVDVGGLVWNECKVGKLPNIRAAYGQAVDDCPDSRLKVAITKRDKDVPLVTTSLREWMAIVKVLGARGLNAVNQELAE